MGKTGEQRKEQIRIIQHEKRSAESEIDKEMRVKKQKEYEIEKRSAESEIERQTRLTKDKEYHSQKRSAESEIDKEMRLNKQKEYNEKRIAESQIVCNLCNSSNHLCRKCKNTVCNFCGEQDPSSDNEMHIMHKKNDTRCKVAESEIQRQRRLNKQKEYDHEKRSAESEIERQRRLTQKKDYQSQKRSGESEIERKERLNKQKKCNKITYRQPTKDWQQELIDKASLTHICTSECRYRPKASMVVVKEKMFTSEEMELLTMNNETLSIDGKYYVCKYCKKFIKKKKIPPCNEKIKKFMIDNLPEQFLTEAMSLSKLESHLLKLIIPFIRIAHIPGYGQYKVKGPMITVEADVTKTLNEKILPRQQELIPVAFKRKLSYKGTVMEEMVSKNKVQAYFDYFKKTQSFI